MIFKGFINGFRFNYRDLCTRIVIIYVISIALV